MRTVTAQILTRVYPPRQQTARKGDYGRLLIVGGNERYTGAPLLAGRAALAAGCDVVTIACPRRVADVAARIPDLITVPLRGAVVTASHLPMITTLVKRSDAVLIGNGLGREKETVVAVRAFLKHCIAPTVVDADALSVVKGFRPRVPTVLTPHAGEFFAMAGTRVKHDLAERCTQVKRAARQLRSVILLKGHVDVISDGTTTYVNRTGNPFMTKGGTG